MENGSTNAGPPMRGGFRGRGGITRGGFDGRGRGRGLGRGGPMNSMPRGFSGPPAMRRGGMLRGIMPRGMGYRGGPSRGSPGRGGRPMNFSYQNQASNQGSSSNEISQKSDSSPNSVSTAQQALKQGQNNSHSPANEPGNTVSVPVNQSSGGSAIAKGNSMRGRGGMAQRRGGNGTGNYNPNINVTGNDVQQASNSSSKPFYRGGLSRGRGGFQQCPTRPNGPMQIAPNHQPGMMQPGMPMKRGPPIGPPGPKRGRYEQVPPHRLQKYPTQNIQGPPGGQGPQGPPTHMQGPPNHHQQSQPQPNFNNSYPSSIPQIQHQANNYYGPQGNGGYDQMNQVHDYTQNYGQASSQSGYTTNGYSQYSQSYPQPSEYDHNQGYSQDYNASSYQQDTRYSSNYNQPDYSSTQYGTSTDYGNTSSDYPQTGAYDSRSYGGYDANTYSQGYAKSDGYQSHAGYY